MNGVQETLWKANVLVPPLGAFSPCADITSNHPTRPTIEQPREILEASQESNLGLDLTGFLVKEGDMPSTYVTDVVMADGEVQRITTLYRLD